MRTLSILLLIALINIQNALANDASDQGLSNGVLMVVGGEPDHNHVGKGNQPELVNLGVLGGDVDETKYKCPPQMASLPQEFARSFPMAEMLNKIVACPTERCFSYEPSTNSWDPFGDLGANFEHAVATRVPGGDLWLMGPTHREQKTALLLADSGELSDDFDIDLPSDVPRIEKGCAVTHDKKTYLMGGDAAIGDTDNDQKVGRMLNVYDHVAGKWDQLGDMNVRRVALGCGFFIDKAGHFYLVAVGGADGLNETATVSAHTYEIYDFKKNKWSFGLDRNLTDRLYFPASVQAKETFLLVGGTKEPRFEDPKAVSHEIYYYDRLDGGLKTTGHKLDIGRKGPGAVLVPYHLVGCKKGGANSIVVNVGLVLATLIVASIPLYYS